MGFVLGIWKVVEISAKRGKLFILKRPYDATNEAYLHLRAETLKCCRATQPNQKS